MRLPILIVTGALAVLAGGCGLDPETASQKRGKNDSKPPPSGKADAWNELNDPEALANFLRKDLEYSMEALHADANGYTQLLDGRSHVDPWPETYWPTWKDSTNQRWQGEIEPDDDLTSKLGKLSPLEKYDVAFNGWMPDDTFWALRPLNPALVSSCQREAAGAPDYDVPANWSSDYYIPVNWDPEYYASLGPAATWQSAHKGNRRARDGVDSDGDTAIDECTHDHDGVLTWFGLCHAWTPASMLEPEPFNTIDYNGVPFTPSDIKALLITIYDESNSLLVGGRCNVNSPIRDENGRIVDVELPAWMNDWEMTPEERAALEQQQIEDCRDTNAGTFHVILTNLLGRHGIPFAEDRTYSDEVWNQPVYDYRIHSIREITSSDANQLLGTPGSVYTFNPDARRFWEVDTSVRYVTEPSGPSIHPTGPQLESYLRQDRYHYIVEGDADGFIVGGEWIHGGKFIGEESSGSYSTQPDFLWVSTGPRLGANGASSNPHVRYDRVKTLLEIAQP